MSCSSAYGGTKVTARGKLSDVRLDRIAQLVLTLSVRYELRRREVAE